MRGVWWARKSIVIAIAAVLSACNGPTAPGPPTASPAIPVAVANHAIKTALTVRVLERGTELPLAEAVVLRDDDIVGRTDGEGMVHADVPVGVEFQIGVKAAGFKNAGVTGTVTSQERWTFYLERQP
jgi:hypothetical protein